MTHQRFWGMLKDSIIFDSIETYNHHFDVPKYNFLLTQQNIPGKSFERTLFQTQICLLYNDQFEFNNELTTSESRHSDFRFRQ